MQLKDVHQNVNFIWTQMCLKDTWGVLAESLFYEGLLLFLSHLL